MSDLILRDAVLARFYHDYWIGQGYALQDFTFDPVVMLVGFTYDQLPVQTTPQILATSTFLNGTSVQDSQTFTSSKTTTATFQWTNTNGVNFGVGVTADFHVGIPVFGGGASVTANKQWTSSASQGASHSEAQTWSWSFVIPVPPKTRVEAAVSVQEASYSPSYRAQIRVRNKAPGVFINYTKPTGELHALVKDLGELFVDSPHDMVQFVDKDTVDVIVRGTFSGVQGVKTIVDTKQFDIDTGALLSVH